MEILLKAQEIFGKLNEIPVETIDPYLCTACKHPIVSDDKYNVCDNCGRIFPILLFEKCDQEYDPPNFRYKPICHFREVLNQVQGKERACLSDAQLEKIRSEVKKHKQLNYYSMRKILRNLRLQKFYENTFFLLNHFGVEIPFFTNTEEERLIRLFLLIDTPFKLYCPRTRKSFMNYYFVLKKLATLIGVDKKTIDKIPNMKDAEYTNDCGKRSQSITIGIQ